MKRQARHALALSLILPVVYAVSCGQDNASRPVEQTSKSGKNEALNQASVATTVSTENQASLEDTALTSDQAPGATTVLDVPAATTPLEDNLLGNPAFQAGADPLMSQLPYYCDPRNYAPNIINNNRACLRFQPIPYTGFGQDHGPDLGLFPPGPIGYRLKDDVGRVSHDDDDDHGHKGRWKSRHRH